MYILKIISRQDFDLTQMTDVYNQQVLVWPWLKTEYNTQMNIPYLLPAKLSLPLHDFWFLMFIFQCNLDFIIK